MAGWLNIKLRRTGTAADELPILTRLRNAEGRTPEIGDTIRIPLKGRDVRAIVRTISSQSSQSGGKSDVLYTITVDELV
jgi:hypothetical protein